MGTQLNLNTPPYFDDFDPTKNYVKVPFVPALPIQARELTTLQSIQHHQMEQFAGHVFKDGSIVEGVPITYYSNTHYVSVEDRMYFANGDLSDEFVSSIDSSFLITNSNTSSDTAVRAIVRISKDGIKADPPNTNRFYLQYLAAGGANNDVLRFEPGDRLYIYSNSQPKFGTLNNTYLQYWVDTLDSNGSFTADGYSFLIGVGAGTVYQKGYFVQVTPHLVTVNAFSTNTTGFLVGFSSTETIVDENIDPSLYDGALGYPNENAPGAHRLKIESTLVAKHKSTLANNDQFFAIVEFDGQLPTEQHDTTELSTIQTIFDNRTYEESGDYVVQPFKVETIDSANTESFYYEISSGVGYVRGKRVEKVGPTKLEVPRATDTEYSIDRVITGSLGNYIVINNVCGSPDFSSYNEVALYDTAQRAVEDVEGGTVSPTGSIVGYANIIACEYDNGAKGTSNAEYLLYLTNVRMNTGKAFSADARSVYSSTGAYGNFVADIVLDQFQNAVIKDGTKGQLIFDSGLVAVKQLTGNSGVGDTSFNHLQTKSGTVQTDGQLSITINSPAVGGTDKLAVGAATYSTSAILDKFVVRVAANTFTTNLAGTTAITSGSAVLAGTSTTFNNDFAAGSQIRIIANSTQNYVRTVATVVNSTYMTLTETLPMSNTSCKFGRYFVGGSELPTTQLVVSSNTTFTAQTSLALPSTAAAYATYPVLRTGAAAIPKVIRKSRFVKIDCSTAGITGPWSLGFAQIHKVRAVYIGDSGGTTYSTSNSDQLNWFIVDDGQRDNMYDLGRLYIRPKFASKITSTTRLLVELDYFAANTSASVGFYSVESYPIDDANTANTTAITTLSIPSYKGLDLRSAIDFRPSKANTAADATIVGSATINPASANANTFSSVSGGAHLIEPDSSFTADFEFYLPRIDLITLNSTGSFAVVRGQPSVKPRVPFVENDQCAIAQASLAGYPTATTRAAESFANAATTAISIVANRRYTMRDIGVLDQRLQKVEYYTVLNALEQQARDLTVPDANGLDRFKNGIFADPFNSHNLGNVTDIEYKVAIDPEATVARPFFDVHDLDFRLSQANSSNIQVTGSAVSLPYTHADFISQRYATNYRICCESNWQWNGRAALYPPHDTFRDDINKPNINISLDLATPWQQLADSPFGMVYGDWRTIGTPTVSSASVTNGWTTTTTTTTTSTQQQTVDALKVNAVTSEYNFGNYVTDVNMQPYIRQQLVAFVIRGMKPNTRLHAFFDDTNVDEHCAPGELSGLSDVSSSQQWKTVNLTGAFGDSLISDANGNIYGQFRIPEATFRAGTRIFQLTNVDSLVTGADARITVGIAQFSADNLQVTRQSSTLTVTQPVISWTESINTQTNTQVDVSTTTIEPVVDIIPPNQGGDSGGGGDPITQSFRIDNLPENISGIFINKVNVYFKSKDLHLGCNLWIAEITNGYPDGSRILGRAYLDSDDIDVSADGQTATSFFMDGLVYLLSGKEYCLIVAPVGNSPEYAVWVGKTGEYDIFTNQQVFSNPYVGTMFVSANRNTWTAIQKEDVKFDIFRCNFNPLTGTAYFNNEPDEYLTLIGVTNLNTSIAVGDQVFTVNSSIGALNAASISSNTIKTSSYPYGRVQFYDAATGRLWLDNSTGGFSNTTNPLLAVYRCPEPGNTAQANSTTLVSYATVSTVDDLAYHAVVPRFGVLQPTKTDLTYKFKGTSNTLATDTQYLTVVNGRELELSDYERVAVSHSNEIGASIANSSTYRIDMTSVSSLVSPVISLDKKAGLFIENLINNDATNEHTRFGKALTKYVSRQVILDDGQEAEDLLVQLTANRPADTDIKIYAKFYNHEDPEAFDDKIWTELQYDKGGDLIFTSTAPSDFREYQFSVPTVNAVAHGAWSNVGTGDYNALTGTITIANNSNVLVGTGTLFTTELTVGDRINVISGEYNAIRTVTSIANATYATVDNGLQQANSAALSYVFIDTGNDGIVEYINVAGGRFIGYKNVALKIVLLSSNRIHVPLLNDVRAQMLQR